jgi:hypothetical protein
MRLARANSRGSEDHFKTERSQQGVQARQARVAIAGNQDGSNLLVAVPSVMNYIPNFRKGLGMESSQRLPRKAVV